jgi:ATP/ADP translocase
MHRTIGYLSKRFAHIRPGEGRKVTLTFLYFFLVITAYYVIKPVSRSLVLGELGSRMVPYVDLICALLMGPVVTVFARLVDRVAKPRLVGLSFFAVTVVMVAFWQLLAWPHSWIAGAFYIWVAIFSVLAVTLFWLVANDLYRPREAKRLFGFIGSGGILGGIVGSSIAAVGAQVLGSQQLILCSAALLVVCWIVVQRLWRLAPDRLRDEKHAPRSGRHETFLSQPLAFAKMLLHSRYLLLLIALVGLNKVIAALIYYQFNPFIEQTFTDVNARTTFTSLFFGSINVLAFVIQFFFTSWILRRWGLGMALLALPVGVLAGTTGMLLWPVFALAAVTELYDASMNYSLQQSAKEVLYLPIDRTIRYKVKPFIDMVVFRFGKGIAAVLGIVLLDVAGMPVRFLTYLTVPCVVVWIVVAAKLRREYTMTLRTTLQAKAASRRIAARMATADDTDGMPVSLGTLTTPRPPHHKLSLAEQLVSSKTSSPHSQTLLQALARYEQPLATGASTSLFEMMQLKATIQNRAISVGERRHAVRLLARQADQDALDYLCGMLLVEEEAALRNEVVRELVKMRLSRRRLQFPTALLRRQIVREVKNYQRIIQVASVYRNHQRTLRQAEDPILAMLRLLLEESVEQVFRLLMLLYRPEDIHLVYEQMQAPDTYVRADAIELLDNLVDPAMRGTLLPMFEEDRFLASVEEAPLVAQDPATAYRVFQEAIWDHNCWLSVTTLCAVGRLRLTTMRQELEKASRHAESLISTAAKVALHLSNNP